MIHDKINRKTLTDTNSDGTDFARSILDSIENPTVASTAFFTAEWVQSEIGDLADVLQHRREFETLAFVSDIVHLVARMLFYYRVTLPDAFDCPETGRFFEAYTVWSNPQGRIFDFLTIIDDPDTDRALSGCMPLTGDTYGYGAHVVLCANVEVARMAFAGEL